jgi:hypothetical protein
LFLGQQGQVFEQAQVGLDLRAKAGALDLDHDFGACGARFTLPAPILVPAIGDRQPRTVDLGHGGRGQRHAVEMREHLLHRQAQRLLDQGLRRFPGQGGCVAVQLLQRGRPFRREQVRASGHDLAQLDEAGAQVFEGHAQALGAAGVQRVLGVAAAAVAAAWSEAGQAQRVDQVGQPEAQQHADDFLQPGPVAHGDHGGLQHGHLLSMVAMRPIVPAWQPPREGTALRAVCL